MEYIRVPSIAENVEVVTIGEWLVEQGQEVTAEDEVVSLLTEKADFNLQTPSDGVVTARLYPARSTVVVGAVLCVLDGSEEDIARARAENEQQSQSTMPSVKKNIVLSDVKSGGNGAVPAGRVRATPAARRLAKEHGVDLAAVAADCGGTVREEDVRAFING